MIQPQLKSYIEQNILPRYDHFDAAHQRDHAEEVIALAEHYDVDENMVAEALVEAGDDASLTR